MFLFRHRLRASHMAARLSRGNRRVEKSRALRRVIGSRSARVWPVAKRKLLSDHETYHVFRLVNAGRLHATKLRVQPITPPPALWPEGARVRLGDDQRG